VTARRGRVAKLEGLASTILQRTRGPSCREDLARFSDDELYSLLPAWFKATSDDELEEVVRLMHQRRPLDATEQARWLDIERACAARLAGEQSAAGIAAREAISGPQP